VVGKLSVLILAFGVLACVLLANRQLRVQSAHELAEVQRRVAYHDRDLWRLRIEIASRVAPDEVERMGRGLGTLVTNSPQRMIELVRKENDAGLEPSAHARAD
jgi:hypothetical protein